MLVGGSRSVLPGSAAWVACQAFVLRCRGPVHVGCASGADQAVVLARPAGLRVWAAFAASGAGSWRSSAVAAVQAAAGAGVPVSWLAGGALALPLVARLARRSRAALAGCGLAVFFAPGPGSLSVARAALAQGIPVRLWLAPGQLPPSLPGACAPVLVGGCWWCFAPASSLQINLF